MKIGKDIDDTMKDLFGKAIFNYYNGDKEKFYFKINNSKYEHDLKKYFRTYKEFTNIEKKIISLSNGEILDVGCGTGMYEPYLLEKGNVYGIDISKYMIEICRKRGIKQIKQCDIFDINKNHKYDTILFIEDNLGMIGKINELERLIKLLDNLLTSNGQILTNIIKSTQDYLEVELIPFYKNEEGESINWIHFSYNQIIKQFGEYNFKVDIVEEDEEEYLLKIYRKS